MSIARRVYPPDMDPSPLYRNDYNRSIMLVWAFPPSFRVEEPMPTYVYACKSCEHQFEIFQSFSDKAKRTCPECKKRQLRKVLFPARVGFKGSGFYVTDSKVSSGVNSGSESSKSSDSKSDGAGKSEGSKSSKDSKTKSASTSDSESKSSSSKNSSSSSSKST